jgi:hypothetical protein
MTISHQGKGIRGPKPMAVIGDNSTSRSAPPLKKKAEPLSTAQVADLMRFKACALDASVNVKTITRWVQKGFLTEWRPYPNSRTRRIKREVWLAFKQRFRPVSVNVRE